MLALHLYRADLDEAGRAAEPFLELARTIEWLVEGAGLRALPAPSGTGWVVQRLVTARYLRALDG